jgi:hypothetical protein
VSAGRLLLALSGWIALAATALPAGSIERIAPTVSFLLLAPGAALVGLRRRRHRAEPADRLGDWTLIVVLSLGLAVIVSEAYYLGHAFGTVRALGTLAALTTLAALAPGRRRPGAGEPV